MVLAMPVGGFGAAGTRPLASVFASRRPPSGLDNGGAQRGRSAGGLEQRPAFRLRIEEGKVMHFDRYGYLVARILLAAILQSAAHPARAGMKSAAGELVSAIRSVAEIGRWIREFVEDSWVHGEAGGGLVLKVEAAWGRPHPKGSVLERDEDGRWVTKDGCAIRLNA